MKHKGYNTTYSGGNATAQKWGYQGQEIVEDLGLNVHEWKYRISDPAIGRFWQIDPLAEKYYFNGIYNFSENDPTSSLELEGLEKIQAVAFGLIKSQNTQVTVGVSYDINTQKLKAGITSTGAKGALVYKKNFETGKSEFGTTTKPLVQQSFFNESKADKYSVTELAIANKYSNFSKLLSDFSKGNDFLKDRVGLQTEEGASNFLVDILNLADKGKVEVLNMGDVVDEIKNVTNKDGKKENILFKGGTKYRIKIKESIKYKGITINYIIIDYYEQTEQKKDD